VRIVELPAPAHDFQDRRAHGLKIALVGETKLAQAAGVHVQPFDRDLKFSGLAGQLRIQLLRSLRQHVRLRDHAVRP
jgi:hypothetical protein